MSKKELKIIKKKYGEKFMQLCRNLFPTILDEDGKLLEIIEDTFDNNGRTLGEDLQDEKIIENFKEMIYNKYLEKNKKIFVCKTEKTPYELMNEAGYELIECKTEEQIQEFKKYYEPEEALCTFDDERLKKCVVYWAVKKDVDKIKRGDFKNPKREDEYGTSVMSIQFNKKGLCTVSIKNRYNHSVLNPDATYGNNLDKIVPGLEYSFKKLLKEEKGIELNLNNKDKFEIPGYVLANDGKYYKYNIEVDGNYYCPGNIIINKKMDVIKMGKPEQGILMEYFYIDMTKEKKSITVCDDIEDSFVDDLSNIKKIDVRNVKKDDVEKIIKIYIEDKEEPILIGLDKNNNIVKYKNNYITNVGDNFLYNNKNLSYVEMKNLESVGNDFFYGNDKIKKIYFPKLKKVGEYFFSDNTIIEKVELPCLESVGTCFMISNTKLRKLNLPKLEIVENCFFSANETLEDLNIPKIKKIGDFFFPYNNRIKKINAPELKEIGDLFLYSNEVLTKFDSPKLVKTGDNFLEKNKNINKEKIGKIDIAQIDKKNELTTSEVDKVYDIVNNIKLEKNLIEKA